LFEGLLDEFKFNKHILQMGPVLPRLKQSLLAPIVTTNRYHQAVLLHTARLPVHQNRQKLFDNRSPKSACPAVGTNSGNA
jgi:hypothetical protein